MRATFDAQRSAFAREGAPSLQQRLSDLAKLRDAVEKNAGRLAAAISADFGNRSRHETEIGELLPVLAAIRHTRQHLRGWMLPRRVAVPFELLPGRARILYHRVLVSARVVVIRHRNVTGEPGNAIVSRALNRRLLVQALADASGCVADPPQPPNP